MSQYESAWAYLQGALEALTPLVQHISAEKLQKRLEEAIQVGRGMSAMAQMPIPEAVRETDLAQRILNTIPPESPPNSGSVFFPHDLQRAGNGTFTPPEPTEEEIEELLRRRSGG